MINSNKKYFLSIVLSIVWLVLLGLGIYYKNISGIIIPAIFSILIIWALIRIYKPKQGLKTEYNPDSLPIIKNGDVKSIMNHINELKIKLNDLKFGEIRYSFIISNDGVLLHPKIIKSVKGIDDSIILSALNNMKNWQPAIKNGNTVAYKFLGGFSISFLKDMEIQITPMYDSEYYYNEFEAEQLAPNN